MHACRCCQCYVTSVECQRRGSLCLTDAVQPMARIGREQRVAPLWARWRGTPLLADSPWHDEAKESVAQLRPQHNALHSSDDGPQSHHTTSWYASLINAPLRFHAYTAENRASEQMATTTAVIVAICAFGRDLAADTVNFVVDDDAVDAACFAEDAFKSL